MPRPQVDEDLGALGLSGERALVAALLRGAVRDARSKGHGHYDRQTRRAAQAWLRDREAVMWWCNLVGLPEWVYDALLREAGMEEE